LRLSLQSKAMNKWRVFGRELIFNNFKHVLWILSTIVFWRFKITNQLLEVKDSLIFQFFLVQDFLKKLSYCAKMATKFRWVLKTPNCECIRKNSYIVYWIATMLSWFGPSTTRHKFWGLNFELNGLIMWLLKLLGNNKYYNFFCYLKITGNNFFSKYDQINIKKSTDFSVILTKTTHPKQQT